MAAIRWLNASVPIISYFNNLVLISCFFGLGVGCLLARRRFPLISLYPLGLLSLVAAVLVLRQFDIQVTYTDDVIFATNLEYYETGLLELSFSCLFGFLVNVLFFVLLGQELGKQLDAIGDPLRAYSWDIAGSLAGVGGYALLAWLQTPPHLWYAIGGGLLLLFLRRWWQRGIAVVVLAGTLFWMQSTYTNCRWSPYYKVSAEEYKNTENKNLGFKILVDNHRIQDALRFGPPLMQSRLWPWVPYYQLPYSVCKPRKVLILGAGCGNEVVMALSQGAEEVHAVEIDPVIAEAGREIHPHRPYTSERVRVIVDDARSYVSRATQLYDLIVMSALDSHRQVAGMSSLRLESFVYTVGSYRSIRDRLEPDGVFCLNLSSTRPWMGQRTYWSLTEAFGREPTVLRSTSSPFESVAYVYAPPDRLQPEALAAAKVEIVAPETRPAGLRLSTDDWPYLYLEHNRIPGFYLLVLSVMILLSTLVVLCVEPSLRSPNFHFFFLGAGFMLLETRSVTQMAQLFGATWNVNSVVFGAILLAIFITNQMVRRGITPTRSWAYRLLYVTLALSYFFPFAWLLEFAVPLRLIIASAVIGLPIVWASFLFSLSFRSVTAVNLVFGSNLLGIVFGGSLEYLSNVLGLSALYWIALVLYACSHVTLARRSA
jgi:hypothetical protein